MAQYRTVTEFLTKMRNAYNESRKKYIEADDKLQAVNKQWKAELSRGWNNAQQKQADTERYGNIIENLKRQKAEIISSFNAEIEGIKAECDNVFSIYDRATGDKIDLATVELLKSGILRTDELKALTDDFNGNCAMLRMIGNYAFNKGEAEKDKELIMLGEKFKDYHFPYKEHIENLADLSCQVIRDDRHYADLMASVYDEKADEIFSKAEGINVKVCD